MWRFEHRTARLLPFPGFLRRVLLHFAVASAVMAAALGLGVVGFHESEGLSWLDALLNASMLLGGMGPVDRPATEIGKLFASFYALFAGLVFVVAAGVVVAPAAHRILHRLHLAEEEEEARERRAP